jgi:hypothetical protein
MKRKDCLIFQVDLQSSRVYTQVSIRELKRIHSVTHPGRPHSTRNSPLRPRPRAESERTPHSTKLRATSRDRRKNAGATSAAQDNRAGPRFRDRPGCRHRESLRPFSRPTATASPLDPGQGRLASADGFREWAGKPRRGRLPVASAISFP